MRGNLENDMWRALSLALVLYSSAAMAEPVVLVSKDGFSTFRGDLIRVENNFYVVRTSIGIVNIPMSEVSCEGPGCPATATGEAAVENEDSEPELTQEQKDALFRKFLEWGRTDDEAN